MARKIAVFSFGRLNPPTIGHGKLADVISAAATKLGAEPMMYLSHTQDKKKNPLPYDLKLKYAQAAFGSVVKASAANTIIKVMQELAADGFTDIVYVAGSDRVNEFEALLNQYNGKEYDFASIKVLSAGERDPDADGVEGMSASKMREAAASGDIKAFTSGLPDKLKPAATTMMKAVRMGMSLDETIRKVKGGYRLVSKKGKNLGTMNMNFGDEILGEAKVTLYTDPNYFGADVSDDAGLGLPVKDIPLAKLVGFETDEKMQDPKSSANMRKMVDLIKSGKGSELPPILVRRYEGGYQVLDGHHRFHAYKAAGAKTIPGKILPDSDIEVKDKGPQDITIESKKASKAEAGYQAKPKGGEIGPDGKKEGKIISPPGNTVGFNVFELSADERQRLNGMTVYHQTRKLDRILQSGELRPRADLSGENSFALNTLRAGRDWRTPKGIFVSKKTNDWFGDEIAFKIKPTDKIYRAYGPTGHILIANPIPKNRFISINGKAVQVDEYFADGKGTGRHGKNIKEDDWDWSGLAAKFKRWLVKATADGQTKDHHIRASSIEMAKFKFARMFPSAKIVSVVQESLEEAVKPTGVKATDGEFYVSDHFMSRAAGRHLTSKKIAQMIYHAIEQHGDRLGSIGPSNFVIRTKDGAGIGVAKVQQPDDSYKYILMTAHPDMRVGRTQTTIMVESDDLNIKIHHDLNPAIWQDGKMRKDVRAKLMRIAEDFKKSLGVDVEVDDITVSGSNAAYSYTDKSDIDLHLVVDIPKADGDALYRELFDAKKFKYNAEHDYKIRGYDVELYVQDANQKHISLGIYSVKDDAWVKAPRHVERVDSTGARYKYDQLKHLIQRAISRKDAALIRRLRDTIKKYRQAGLAAHGEFGAENLAFKALRANGHIKDLYDAIKDIQDAELSIGEQRLDEISMSPSSLRAFAGSPAAQGMTIGFEAEMVVLGMEPAEDDEYESEPDYDMDETVETSSLMALQDDLANFFRPSESRRSIERAVEQFNEGLLEHMEEEFQEWLSDNQDEVRAAYKDDTELSDEEIQQSMDADDSTYTSIVDSLRDRFYGDWDDLRKYLLDNDLESMRDWAREYNLDWPHWTEPYGGGEGGVSDESINMVADELKKVLGAKVNWGTSYKSVTRSMTDWALEPDPSINTSGEDEGGLELISPPMPLANGLAKLERFFDWASSYGVYTNRSTGFHMGVSIPDQTMDNIDHLKLVLFLGDQHVLEKFGRSANNYTKSMLAQMKGKAEKVDVISAFDIMRKGMDMIAGKALGDQIIPRGDRYVSVNIKSNYVEFRSAGGDYLSNKDKIRDTLLRYVRVMALAADPNAERQEYAKKLYKLLSSITGDETNTIKAFSLYRAGAINRSDLIGMLKKAQVARVTAKQPKGSEPAQATPGGSYGQGPGWWQLIDRNGEVVSNFQAPDLAAAQARQAEIERQYGERFVVVPSQGNSTNVPSQGNKTNRITERYEIFDLETGQRIRDLYIPIVNDNWTNGDEQAIALVRRNRASFGDRNVSVRRASDDSKTKDITESKTSMSGSEMMEYYNACHYNHMCNSGMEEYVKSHDWHLSECGSDDLPDADEYRDDYFGRDMKLDLERVKHYMLLMSEGEQIAPIIMGPRRSIIDGNHRGQAARKLKLLLSCYKPMISEKRKMDLMIGGHSIEEEFI